ncbi:MAG: retroviral-like aspartic protease family protein [Nitrospinae bacterium]|nr:retroviral-like aspartic protease family protein [Nitrospinota bacterium]MDE0330523.1 retroviral-like aspartic protease family protein [Nitrospinota bacterium]
MLSTDCGFSNREDLVKYGPTLLVDVGFDPTFDPGKEGSIPIPSIQQIHAVVDTGATISCIDKQLAAQLKLPVVDRENLAGIGGAYVADMHAAQIYIPALDHIQYGSFAGVDLVSGGQRHFALIGRTFLGNFQMDYNGITGKVVIRG